MMVQEKAVLITGATDGIGKASIFEILRKHASRIARGKTNPEMKLSFLIHGRSKEKCQAVLAEVKKDPIWNKHGGRITCVIADFMELNQVRRLPEQVRAFSEKIDVLVNNAGVYFPKRVLSKDGYEATFQVNHLAHFLLTRELLPFLLQSEDPRIIHVSSMVHAHSIDFSNLNGERTYDGFEAYARSKLCNILFSNELKDRFEEKGYRISTNSLHPGVINTKLLRSGGWFNGRPASEGGQRIAFLVIEDAGRKMTGGYFVNDQLAKPASIAQDKATKQRLWEISSEFVGLASQI